MADLDAELAVLRDAMADSGRAPMVEISPSEARERVTAGHRLCSDGPAVTVHEVVPPPEGQAGGPPVPLRVYEDGDPASTVVYAHGGGWVTGDLDYSDELCRFLARDASVRVVSVDYRLAPEHPFPAGLEDLQAAWAWSQRSYGGPHALGGDSAGGSLAAALTLRLASAGVERPLFLLLLYPVLALPDSTLSYSTNATAFPIGAADMRWFFRHYLSDDAPSPPTPDLAPLHATTLSSLPPTHLVLAGHDPLHDEGAAFAARLATDGVAVTTVEHPGLCHGFLRFTAASAAAREARSEVVDAVRRLASHASSPAQSAAAAGGPASASAAARCLPPTEENP